MYDVDEHDRVLELEDLPASSPGAPCPIVLADEVTLLVAYYLDVPDPAWDGTYVRVVDPATTAAPVAVVAFRPFSSFVFGFPDQDELHRHALSERGLRPYAAFEVQHSSWIRGLLGLRSRPRSSSSSAYGGQRHFILTFHDTMLECIARGYTSSIEEGPGHRAIDVMKAKLATKG